MSEIEKTMEDLTATIVALFITYDIVTSKGIGKQVLDLFSKFKNQLKDTRITNERNRKNDAKC